MIKKIFFVIVSLFFLVTTIGFSIVLSGKIQGLFLVEPILKSVSSWHLLFGPIVIILGIILLKLGDSIDNEVKRI